MWVNLLLLTCEENVDSEELGDTQLILIENNYVRKS